MILENEKDNNFEAKRIRYKYLVNRNRDFFKNFKSNIDKECPYCGRALRKAGEPQELSRNAKGYKPDVDHHLPTSHLDKLIEVLEEEENTKEECNKGNICPICNLTWINMKTHVKRIHNLEWEDFVSQYNYEGESLKFTDEHKKTLSINKKAFYDSDRGQIQKQIQSKGMAGDKNIACKDEVRLKISQSCMGRRIPEKYKANMAITTSERMINGTLNLPSFGYSFLFFWKDKYYYTRSYEELLVILALLKNNIDFKQEPCYIKYINEEGNVRTYIPDFQIGNIYYETKSTEKEFLAHKYVVCKKKLKAIGSDLRLLKKSTIHEELGVLVPSKEQVKSFVQESVKKGTMYIIKPSKHTGHFTLLEDLLGKDFEEKLNNIKDKFYEDKENYHNSNTRTRL